MNQQEQTEREYAQAEMQRKLDEWHIILCEVAETIDLVKNDLAPIEKRMDTWYQAILTLDMLREELSERMHREQGLRKQLMATYYDIHAGRINDA